MRWLTTFGRTAPLLVLLTASIPLTVNAIQTRDDLCGLSMHASDFPDVGDFSSVEASWSIPTIPNDWQHLGAQDPQTFQGVSLCCGDDCSSRLGAGFRAYSAVENNYWTAEPTIFMGPQFEPKGVITGLYLNSSDTLWTHLEIITPTKARVKFTKFGSRTMNETTVTQVNITEREGKTVLVFHTDGEGGGITWEYETTNELRNPNGPQPSFCGDSAWWYLSDNSDPWDDVTPRPLTPAWFSPFIIEDHGLVTTHGKSFPADLPLSGQARFWNLAREVAGKTQDVCQVKSFVDTGMTLLRSPFVPNNYGRVGEGWTSKSGYRYSKWSFHENCNWGFYF